MKLEEKNPKSVLENSVISEMKKFLSIDFFISIEGCVIRIFIPGGPK